MSPSDAKARNADTPLAHERRASRSGPWLIVLLAALALLPGCVRRRMTIRTNPPGALVYIDGYEIGTTPVSTSYIYYGTRDITLIKDGYETLKVKQAFPAPWYQIPPIDFVSENLVPYEIRDERTLNFTLAPQIMAPTDRLLGRADNMRQAAQAQAGVIPQEQLLTPPPGSSGIQTLPPGGEIIPLPQVLPPPSSPPVVDPQSLPPGGTRRPMQLPRP